MAKLNEIEGQAHVEAVKSNNVLTNLKGYIILNVDPITTIGSFDIAGPQSHGVYKGPVLIGNDFFNIHIEVRIRGIKSPRVEFVGEYQPSLLQLIDANPDDFLE